MFACDEDSSYPQGGVIFGPGGALYGTTSGQSFTGNFGNVFRLRPQVTACKSALCSWAETVLYAIPTGADGNDPLGDLAFDQSGNIYGTTLYGGSANGGVVYELTPPENWGMQSVLHSFVGGSDGSSPYSGVTLDSGGNIYGTTGFGGSNDTGTIYQLVPSQPAAGRRIFFTIFRTEATEVIPKVA